MFLVNLRYTTGKEGEPFCTDIQDLAKQNTTNSIPYTILVLSRNPTSGTAVRLGALPGVKIIAVEKDVMDAPLKVFEKLDRDGVVKKGEIYGVFSNQGYVSDALMVSQGEFPFSAGSLTMSLFTLASINYCPAHCMSSTLINRQGYCGRIPRLGSETPGLLIGRYWWTSRYPSCRVSLAQPKISRYPLPYSTG